MKQKKLAIMISLIWFLLVCGLYIFDALVCRFPVMYILQAPPLAHQLLRAVWLFLPPLLWWIPRKALMRKEKWHPIGTAIFCIGSVVLLVGDIVFMNVEEIKNSACWERYCDPSAMIRLFQCLSIQLAFELFFFLFHCVKKISNRPHERNDST